MTQNVYVGVDLFDLVDADSTAALLLTLGRFLDQLDPDRYAARARGIAASITTAQPDVVALQEVTQIEQLGEEERETIVDMRSQIQSALAVQDLSYEIAAQTATADLTLPTLGDQAGLRVANRDVLLVQEDHSTANVMTGTYDATASVAIPDSDRTFSIERGYAAADVTVEDATFTAISTHFEASSRSTRETQATELLELVPTDRPVVLAGDFNSGPGTTTDAYTQLTDRFEDPFATLHPNEDAFTCCQAGNLENEQSQLEKRVDTILSDGDMQPTAVRRVGHRRKDRITFDSEAGPVELWPSDHAGVVATFEMETQDGQTPTATPTTTPTPVSNTQTATESDASPETTNTTPITDTVDSDDGNGPGFGVISALGAVGGLGYALRRRLGRNE